MHRAEDTLAQLEIGKHHPFEMIRAPDGWRISHMTTESVTPEANPAKVEDFGDKDLPRDVDLARILFGEASPLRRDAR